MDRGRWRWNGQHGRPTLWVVEKFLGTRKLKRKVVSWLGKTAKSLFIYIFFSFLFLLGLQLQDGVQESIMWLCHNGHIMGHMIRVTWGPWESKCIATVVKCISSRELSENSIEFSLSNSEQRDSWLNSSHWTLDADTDHDNRKGNLSGTSICCELTTTSFLMQQSSMTQYWRTAGLGWINCKTQLKAHPNSSKVNFVGSCAFSTTLKRRIGIAGLWWDGTWCAIAFWINIGKPALDFW